ncbi:hypothetical protein ROE7235_01714 [Roseibaca ekhonensis]|uniref:Sulfotransferase domain-containing protein n=1 Tax=Roseinatronobacter ekhonensis TaxID=254356 RepID=A0A3B0M8H3_9RHOB|nr:sulfotransferase [Roseibaca ekhonensis]SUZ31963.1 hypothetical protein ROE7235_01714 [Roseibaca ekhonensis]
MTWPNLFIVGAMKAGTTALHAYLDQHPDVFMCDPKEPGFFAEAAPDAQAQAQYRQLFAAGADCRYRGESSTKYAKAPYFTGVADRIAATCPDARILFMVRDPVARIVSQYLFYRRVQGETLPLRAAVAQNPRYRAFGDYSAQIAPFQARFGSVLVLQAEDLSETPQAVMDRVFNWLDLPAATVAREERRNNSADALRRHDGATRVLIRHELEPLRRLVKRMGAQGLAKRVWTRLNPPATSPVSAAEIAQLRADLAPWVQEQARALEPLMAGKPLRWEG